MSLTFEESKEDLGLRVAETIARGLAAFDARLGRRSDVEPTLEERTETLTIFAARRQKFGARARVSRSTSALLNWCQQYVP